MKNAELLALTIDDVRNYTLMYGKKLIDAKVDLTQTFTAENGVQLNSALFILGHLAVTENFLCLSCTGGEIVRFPWAKLFSLGAPIPNASDCPSIDEILSTLTEVHQKSLMHIRSLSDEQLLIPNTKGVKFASDETIRGIILHAIRHEGSHAGHLGWLCKLHGIKTF